jgi:hypothetical protein
LVDDIKVSVATQEALQKAIAEMKVNADANDVKVHSTSYQRAIESSYE